MNFGPPTGGSIRRGDLSDLGLHSCLVPRLVASLPCGAPNGLFDLTRANEQPRQISLKLENHPTDLPALSFPSPSGHTPQSDWGQFHFI